MNDRHSVCVGVFFMATALILGVTVKPPPSVAAAQSAGIVGTVVARVGQPLAGVTVTAIAEAGGLPKRATTGSDGTYRVDGLPDDTYRVDFDLLGFDMIRRNHVRVRSATTSTADAVMAVSSVCDCVTVVPSAPVRQRAGRVVDEAGRPLPHARLELVSPRRREVAYADSEGRFLVRVPVTEAWPLTASDTGFRAVRQEVSGLDVAEPIEFRLVYAATTGLPDIERFGRGCRCPGDLFSHDGR